MTWRMDAWGAAEWPRRWCTRQVLDTTRRISVPASLAVALLAGCASLTPPADRISCVAPEASTPHQVIVEVPEVYELGNIALALTNYQSLARHTVLAGPYLTQVGAHFAGVRAHPLIAALNTRLTSGGSWNYDAYYGFRENAFVYEFGLTSLARKPGYTRAWGGTDVFTRELERVEDFSEKSGFRSFYAGQASLYEGQIRRYQELVSVERMWRWLEERFPYRYDRYRIVFSPLINGSHSTQRFTTNGVRETVMFVAGPDVVPDSIGTPMKTAHLERLVFTEIDHNYVNPATGRYQQRINRIFANVGSWNGNPASYRSPVATFNEYMTWAVFDLYALDAYDPVTAAAIRENVIWSMVQSRRFHRFREFRQVVADVALAAGPQPCIPNLYSEILDRVEQADWSR